MNLCPHRRALACAGGALGAWFNASVGVCGLYLMITTMTIDEICIRQLETGNGEMYLKLCGVFWHAYDGAAFAMARITGYEIKKLKTKNRYDLGFGEKSLHKVLALMWENGFQIENYQEGDDLVRFSGGNPEIDDDMVAVKADSVVKAAKAGGVNLSKEDIMELLDLRRQLLGINLADRSLDYQQLSRKIRELQVHCLTKISI